MKPPYACKADRYVFFLNITEELLSVEGAERKRSLELAELISTIEQAEERWLELSELAPWEVDLIHEASGLKPALWQKVMASRKQDNKTGKPV